MQLSFFDEEDLLKRLSELGDILEKLDKMVDWTIFKPILDKAILRKISDKGGRPPYGNLLMFKILIIKRLYNLSFDNIQFQITDRASFKRFLGLKVCSKVPDAKTIWLYEDLFSKSDVGKELFDKFFEIISANNYVTRTGSIVDATFIESPSRKNTKEQRETLKEGKIPEEWDDAEHPQKLLQRDTDATWTKKGNKSYFGYKDHTKVDKDSKIITDYKVTTASTNDHKGAEKLIDKEDKVVYGDSAYSNLELPEKVENKLHEKSNRNHPLSDEQKKSNQEKSKTRCRVEHVFAGMVQMVGGTYIRCKNLSRAVFNISLLNLLYNMRRVLSLKDLNVKNVG